jgi:Ca2+-binding EF-hand superfamily protein
MPESHRPIWLALAASAVLAAAAAAQPEGHPAMQGGEPGHDREGRHRDVSSLFISPAGQPFRAAPGYPYPVSVWFAAADRDHNGKLTRIEMRQDGRRFFQILDLNNDGVIDGSEIAAYEHGMVPEILEAADIPDLEGPGRGEAGEGGRGGGRMGGHGGRGRGGEEGDGQGPSQRGGMAHSPLGAAPYSLTFVVEPVSNDDADLDGKVTMAEFLAALDRRFDELDSMGRGYLTLGALPKTRVQQMHGMHAASPP